MRNGVSITLGSPNPGSDKFWAVSTWEATMTITEGNLKKIKESKKTFQSVEQCIEAAQKLIDQKLKAGYKPNTQPGSRELEAMEGWESDKKKDKDKKFSGINRPPYK